MRSVGRNDMDWRLPVTGTTHRHQLAKNLFLWPEKSLLRKGQEAVITLMIETTWSKRRILEVYMNEIEWGTGIFGAEAAARHYFGITASALSDYQAAMLAAFGLSRPMSYEPWHIQLGGSGSGLFGGSFDVVAILKSLVGDLLDFTVPGGGVMVDIMKSIPGKVFDWGAALW